MQRVGWLAAQFSKQAYCQVSRGWFANYERAPYSMKSTVVSVHKQTRELHLFYTDTTFMIIINDVFTGAIFVR